MLWASCLCLVTYLGKPCGVGWHCVCYGPGAHCSLCMTILKDLEPVICRARVRRWKDVVPDPVLEEIKDQWGSFSIMQDSTASEPWSQKPFSTASVSTRSQWGWCWWNRQVPQPAHTCWACPVWQRVGPVCYPLCKKKKKNPVSLFKKFCYIKECNIWTTYSLTLASLKKGGHVLWQHKGKVMKIK